MKTFEACIPCFMRQAQEATAMATKDPELRNKILAESKAFLASVSPNQPPPRISRDLYTIVRSISKNPDPYEEVKRTCNENTLALYDEIKQQITKAKTPLKTALQLSIAGNLIDWGIPGKEKDQRPISDIIDQALRTPFAVDNFSAFEQALESAKHILYFADNAGEIVLDKALIELLGPPRITLVVRQAPIINDVTMDDVKMLGLDQIVNVITTNSATPGVLMSEESDLLVDRFKNVDLVISKGQGNYETLESETHSALFFLLKVKCAVVARDLGCQMGDSILKKG